MEPVISLQNVCYRYPTGLEALKDINVDIPFGKKVAILGGNGAGKSTLLMLLNGLFRPHSGKLKFTGASYTYNRKGLRWLRKQVGMLFHDPDSQLIAPSVREELSFGLMNLSDDQEWVVSRVESVIEQFELEELADRPPHQLSSGQKKRVCMASIVAMEPEVVVCDEPSSSLDPYHTGKVFDELEKLNRKGKTIIYTSHDVDQVYEWADDIILMNKGEVLFHGSVEKTMANGRLLEVCGLKYPVIYEISKNMGWAVMPRSVGELKAKLKERCMDLL